MKKSVLKKSFITNILTICCTVTLLSCSDDIITDFAENNQETKELTIVVNEPSENTTRAIYNNYTTTFETGDEIGIYAFDGKTYKYSNVKFTKRSDGKWTSDTKVLYNNNYTYYAYYPYRTITYSPGTTLGDETVKFSNFIQDSNNYFWKTDQSTKANFTASNLCMATGVVSSAPTVVFNMKHQRGLAVITGTERNNISYSGNIPYDLGLKRVFLTKPGTSTTVGSNTFKIPAGIAIVKDISKDYLCFTAQQNGTISLTIDAPIGTSNVTSVSYSTDNGATWVTTNNNDNNTIITITTPTIQTGNKVLWKGIANSYGTANNFSVFSSTGNVKLSGNIMSLLYGDNFENQTSLSGKRYAFKAMFLGYFGLKITSAKELKLPATTLAEGCYSTMFGGCTSLTTAPKLPATTLAENCYSSMFASCTSLTTAPELPATTLATSCYANIFNGCTSLKKITSLATNISASNCIQNWVKDVATIGTFIKNESMSSWPNGDSGIPSGWTVVDN